MELDTHVPLIVRLPGQKAGLRTRAFVEFADLFATVAEAAGFPAPADVEGISMLPLFRHPDQPWKSATFSPVSTEYHGR